MNPDARLVAALMIPHGQLVPIVDEALAGRLDHDERREFARGLMTIAADLKPGIIMVNGGDCEFGAARCPGVGRHNGLP